MAEVGKKRPLKKEFIERVLPKLAEAQEQELAIIGKMQVGPLRTSNRSHHNSLLKFIKVLEVLKSRAVGREFTPKEQESAGQILFGAHGSLLSMHSSLYGHDTNRINDLAKIVVNLSKLGEQNYGAVTTKLGENVFDSKSLLNHLNEMKTNRGEFLVKLSDKVKKQEYATNPNMVIIPSILAQKLRESSLNTNQDLEVLEQTIESRRAAVHKQRKLKFDEAVLELEQNPSQPALEALKLEREKLIFSLREPVIEEVIDNRFTRRYGIPQELTQADLKIKELEEKLSSGELGLPTGVADQLKQLAKSEPVLPKPLTAEEAIKQFDEIIGSVQVAPQAPAKEELIVGETVEDLLKKAPTLLSKPESALAGVSSLTEVQGYLLGKDFINFEQYMGALGDHNLTISLINEIKDKLGDSLHSQLKKKLETIKAETL